MGKEYIQDRFGNQIYITDERWAHVCKMHPDMIGYDQQLRETLRKGSRRQDALDPNKFFYSKKFNNLPDLYNHVVVVVKFGYTVDEAGQQVANNFVLTA